jgi:hypothetical protein
MSPSFICISSLIEIIRPRFFTPRYSRLVRRRREACCAQAVDARCLSMCVCWFSMFDAVSGHACRCVRRAPVELSCDTCTPCASTAPLAVWLPVPAPLGVHALEARDLRRWREACTPFDPPVAGTGASAGSPSRARHAPGPGGPRGARKFPSARRPPPQRGQEQQAETEDGTAGGCLRLAPYSFLRCTCTFHFCTILYSFVFALSFIVSLPPAFSSSALYCNLSLSLFLSSSLSITPGDEVTPKATKNRRSAFALKPHYLIIENSLK